MDDAPTSCAANIPLPALFPSGPQTGGEYVTDRIAGPLLKRQKAQGPALSLPGLGLRSWVVTAAGRSRRSSRERSRAAARTARPSARPRRSGPALSLARQAQRSSRGSPRPLGPTRSGSWQTGKSWPFSFVPSLVLQLEDSPSSPMPSYTQPLCQAREPAKGRLAWRKSQKPGAPLSAARHRCRRGL